MKSANASFGMAVLLCFAIMTTGGCKSDSGGAINPTIGDSQGDRGLEPEDRGGQGLPDLDPERLLFNRETGLKLVYFDYDSFELRPDALATLRDNAEKIKRVPSVIIQIEGHCDERGTQEYNLALGEKRALATRAHLINLGISGDRMITISYGEEDPADPSHNESAWSKNRRSAFNQAM